MVIKGAISGAVLWACAAGFIQGTSANLFSNDTTQGTATLLYAVTVPVVALITYSIKFQNDRQPVTPTPDKMLKTVLAGIASATLLDGLIMLYAPQVYGTQAMGNAKAGAFLLWGIGIFAVTALTLSSSKSKN